MGTGRVKTYVRIKKTGHGPRIDHTLKIFLRGDEMGNNIENRLVKLEDRVGIGQKAETVDEMFQKMQRGEYGRDKSLAGIVTAYMSASDKSKFFDSLRQQLPGPLVDAFAHQMTAIDSR